MKNLFEKLMKNLIFVVLFSSCLISFTNASQTAESSKQEGTTSRIAKHKWKIATTVVSIALAWRIYKTQTEWKELHIFFTDGLENNTFDTPEAVANRLANFTKNSWFIFPWQKRIIIDLIKKNPTIFCDWKSSADSSYFWCTKRLTR